MTEEKNKLELIVKPRFEPHVSLNDVFGELIERLNKATPIHMGDTGPPPSRSCSVTEEEWAAIKRLLRQKGMTL